MEGDREKRLCHHSPQPFQSTPSAWRETGGAAVTADTFANFNPLPPHGGRPIYRLLDNVTGIFQSTPSAWRETPLGQQFADKIGISIHSLRMEGDEQERQQLIVDTLFQSTPSAWRETEISLRCRYLMEFQSTPSAWRETEYDPETGLPLDISIHSLRMEGDRELHCRSCR